MLCTSTQESEISPNQSLSFGTRTCIQSDLELRSYRQDKGENDNENKNKNVNDEYWTSDNHHHRWVS